MISDRRLALVAAAVALAGLGGCDDAQPSGPPETAAVAFEPAPASMRRLTDAQYRTAITDLLGDDLVLPGSLEPDGRFAGSIALGATVRAVSERGVEQYGDAAFALAEQALSPERRARIVDCAPEGARDDACAGQVLSAVGRRAWRRPLAEAELARLVDVSGRAGEVLADFYAGLSYGLAGLIQSPHFIYRIETGALAGADGAERRLDAYELASRLSFFLWDAPPDAALLDAAASGRLDTVEGLRAEAERLAADPRLRAGVRAFFSDLFELDRLDRMTKAPELFPHYDAAVGPAAREQTLRFVERLIIDERADYRDIMTSRVLDVDRKLASIYDVRAPAREGFGAVELGEDSMRLGLLGQTSVLAMASHPVSTSATLRGMFVRNKLLCQPVPMPPSGVDTSIPEPSGETPTLRDRVAEHLTDPACSGCHSITDPIGLALENFDGIGRFRADDNGAAIDASGILDGTPFDGPIELAWAIREHKRFAPCIVDRLYRYALGREAGEGDEAMLAALTERFVWHDHDVMTLMLDIVASPAFSRVGAPAEVAE